MQKTIQLTRFINTGQPLPQSRVTGRRLLSYLRQPACALAVFTSFEASAISNNASDLELLGSLVGAAGEHCEEAIQSGDFAETFVCGDEFFEFSFNAVDGGGANVGDGGRYTRLPRADLVDWTNQVPMRPTGPNAASCAACHETPVGTAAGTAAMNVIRDPLHSANPGQMIQRNTPHIMGSGALQLLAEEMTTKLQATRDAAMTAGEQRELIAKGVYFGYVDARGNVYAEGVDDDLVVRPFEWKGVTSSLREFTLAAMNNEIGMQPVEVVGDSVDGDGDGVVNEASIDDITATVIYMAGQTRPHTELELDALRQKLTGMGAKGRQVAQELGLPTLSGAERRAIRNGRKVFDTIGCQDCHKAKLKLDSTVFQEPSTHPDFNAHALAAGLSPHDSISFDLAGDMLDNQVDLGKRMSVNLANLKRDRKGRGVVELYGDLKRHDMGPGLAENIDETGHGSSVWLTKELWGIGQTAPYLHDGRATTIPEAILQHGGEAESHAQAFRDLPTTDQGDLTRFLQNLVILKAEGA